MEVYQRLDTQNCIEKPAPCGLFLYSSIKKSNTISLLKASGSTPKIKYIIQPLFTNIMPRQYRRI
jgi:hypothetical protein